MYDKRVETRISMLLHPPLRPQIGQRDKATGWIDDEVREMAHLPDHAAADNAMPKGGTLSAMPAQVGRRRMTKKCAGIPHSAMKAGSDLVSASSPSRSRLLMSMNICCNDLSVAR